LYVNIILSTQLRVYNKSYFISLILYLRSTDVFALSQEFSISVIFCNTQKYIVEKYNSITGLNLWQACTNCTRYYGKIRNDLLATILLKMIQNYDSLDAYTIQKYDSLDACYAQHHNIMLMYLMEVSCLSFSKKDVQQHTSLVVTVCTRHTVCCKYLFLHHKYIRHIKRSVFTLRNLANERLVYQNSMLRHVSPYLFT